MGHPTNHVSGAQPVVVPQGSDAEAIVKAMEKYHNPTPLIEHGGKTRIIAVPREMRVESLKPLLDQYLETPERIKGTALLHTEESFIDHVNRFSTEATAVFVNATVHPPTVTAVFDYHMQQRDDDESEKVSNVADWSEHRARWTLQLSKEWQAWIGRSGKAMTHAEFAEFLELHIPDVYSGQEYSDRTKQLIDELGLRLASSAQLVALSRNLSVNVDAAVKSAQTLSSGEISLQYVETHRDGEGNPIRVPNAFLIAIPVVLHGPAFQVLVRLRYRVIQQKVNWFFELHRTDAVFDKALEEIVARVAETTAVPVFFGAPEA